MLGRHLLPINECKPLALSRDVNPYAVCVLVTDFQAMPHVPDCFFEARSEFSSLELAPRQRVRNVDPLSLATRAEKGFDCYIEIIDHLGNTKGQIVFSSQYTPTKSATKPANCADHHYKSLAMSKPTSRVEAKSEAKVSPITKPH